MWRARFEVRWIHRYATVWGAMAVVAAIAANYFANLWARWRSPGGSSFPAGLPLAVALSAAAIVAAGVGARRRLSVATVLLGLAAFGIATFTLWYIASAATALPLH